MTLCFCLNPACPNPSNSSQNKLCGGCDLPLSQCSQQFDFRQQFRITNILGEGAFGRTYLATDLIHIERRKCVVKKFLANLQGSQLQLAKELFTREAQQLHALNHPQIPELYYFFDHTEYQQTSLFLVQEFIEGTNLHNEWKQNGNFSEKKIRQLLDNLLPVLDYLNQLNILHRDIKPANIMRRTSTKDLVLIDFGAAKQTTQTSLSRQGTQIYTVGYAAGEHIRGFASAASDIYALGVTCLRLLTGTFVHVNSSGEQVDELYDPMRDEWMWRTYIKKNGIRISANLASVLDKMVAPKAADRYQSAAEVLADLHSSQRQSAASTVVLNNTQIPTTLQTQSPKSRSQPTSHRVEFALVTVNSKGEGDRQKNRRGQAEYISFNLGRGIDLKLVKIPAGKFLMGTSTTDIAHLTQKFGDHFQDEQPQHHVTLQEFYLGMYPVTQAQWQAIMAHPTSIMRDNRPKVWISWNEAQAFCEKLSDRVGMNFRLPSEAEWEYACRAGTKTLFSYGTTLTTNLANYDPSDQELGIFAQEQRGQAWGKVTEVGYFSPNDFGLYDMHGNVWEWCADDYHPSYEGAPQDGTAWLDFTGNATGQKVLRGGAWNSMPVLCRSAVRGFNTQDGQGNCFGFRVVCSSSDL